MCNVVKNIGAMFAASLVSRPNFSDYGYSASVLYNFLSLSELSAPWYGADLNTSSATDTGACTNVNVRPTPNLSVLTVIMVMTVVVMHVDVMMYVAIVQNDKLMIITSNLRTASPASMKSYERYLTSHVLTNSRMETKNCARSNDIL